MGRCAPEMEAGMRSLPGIISAAISSPTQQPSLTVTIQDVVGHFGRLNTGNGTNVAGLCALVPYDGGAVRAVLDGATIRAQWIAILSVGGWWDAATSVITTNAVPAA